VLASALMIAIALGFGWIEVLRLYQGLGLSLFGGLMLTIGQLAILPNLIAFGSSWIAGVGFAIGEGSYVSPLATQLGPLPALPVFAAIPTGGFDRGILFALVPVVAAFFATVLSRKFSDSLRWEYATRFAASSALAVVAATVAGILAWLLALVASGSFGPGRFDWVGVDSLVFAGVIFLQVLVPTFLASLVVVSPYTSAEERK
ncbi:MAG: DUF6350 family protein, partial [Aquiluna sp.]